MAIRILRTSGLAALAACVTGIAISGAQAAPPIAQQQSFTLPPVNGYLAKAEVPDSLLILKSPPAAGSAAEARDREANGEALLLHDTARWKQAVADARLDFPNAVEAFDCTLGIEISASSTPRLYRIMQRTLLDFGLSTSPSKVKFQRARPFMVNEMPMCTPEYDNLLRKDGSYPSGHSAVGFGWGMVMAAIAPEKAASLMRRGIDFGDSRRICNVHWLSDVEDGRLMGAAVYARLSGLSEFRRDLKAASREYRRALTAKRLPKRDCT